MKLFELGRIGTLTLKNRIVMAPMANGLGELVDGGGFSQRDIDYYVARAKGGTGMIITNTVLPSQRLEAAKGATVVSGSQCVRWLNDLAEALHSHGARVFVQLTAGWGRAHSPTPGLPNGGLVAPSEVPSFWDPSITCRPLTRGEIEGIIEDFELSCRMIRVAGIDGIEIHAHQGYLIDEFVTALWNKRTDEYGGDLSGRLTLPMRLIEAARRGAGNDFPLTYRYGLTHYMEGGRTIKEGLEIAHRLEAAGVDGLHIDSGCYETNNRAQPPTTQPPGGMVELAAMTKEIVKLPVIAVGKLGYPELAERALEEGKADFIALGRSLLADPEWANKVKEGRLEDIVPCLGCHEGCLRRLFDGKHISCAVNPACGRERETMPTLPIKRKKSVLVIGGGPAGMEAARVATLRGHKVTLWEKSHALGGNLILAAIPDFKQDYKYLLDYLTTQIRKLGVEIKLGFEATEESIQRMDPDVLFIATGAKPIIPDITGIEKGIKKEKVFTCVDALLGKKEVGKSIVIIGGGLIGCETGLWLAQKGKKIVVIARHEAMRDMYWINAKDVKEKLDEAEAKLLTFTSVSETTDDGIVTINEKGVKSVLSADTILVAVRLEPNRELVDTLQGSKIPEVYPIGDCVESRIILDAIWEGFRSARLI